MRQLNVQQQNALVEQSIREQAQHWRQGGVPAALKAFGEDRGVDWERSIVLRLEIDFPGIGGMFGEILTQEARFVHFDIETDGVVRVIEWTDITDAQNLHTHNRGFGAGRGALALKVLRDLQAEAAAPATSSTRQSP